MKTLGGNPFVVSHVALAIVVMFGIIPFCLLTALGIFVWHQLTQ